MKTDSNVHGSGQWVQRAQWVQWVKEVSVSNDRALQRSRGVLAAVLMTALLVLGAVSSSAQVQQAGADARTGVFRVTVTNATSGQVLSPPLAVFHHPAVALFRTGEPALPELALLAEDGDAGPLLALATGLDAVSGGGIAPGPVPPGASITWEVEGMVRDRVSVLGMLVNTNDVFFAVNTAEVSRPRFSRRTFAANGYDAGSEENNEDCDFIPGPACAGAGAGVRAEAGAEGFVTISNGIHGVADLDPAAYDWRNPTVFVTVQRIR